MAATPATVSVLLGNGNGTFAPAVNYATGNGDAALTTGDLNNDGKLDIITTNYQANTISVLLGNGDGTFATKVDYPSGGTNPFRIIAGDFNGDKQARHRLRQLWQQHRRSLDQQGRRLRHLQARRQLRRRQPAPMTSSPPTSTVTKSSTSSSPTTTARPSASLKGNGDGTFQAAKVDYAASAQTHAPSPPPTSTAIDKPDLITGNYASGNDLNVLLNNGSGTFATPVAYADGSSYVYDVQATDLNNDGKMDLVTADYEGNHVGVLYGLGNGSFGPPSRTAPISASTATRSR